MEARGLIEPEFWRHETPVLVGASHGPPAGLPGLVYFQTSGSTGVPKWIGLSRRALQISAKTVNEHLDVSSSSVWALALPILHVGGFGVAARAYQAGCQLVQFPGKWSAEGFSKWLHEMQATHLSLVPTQVHDLVAAGLRAPSSLRAIVVGGGVLPMPTGRTARELGWPVLASYGMTEAGSQVATQGIELLDEPYVTGPLGILPCWDVVISDQGLISINGEALFSGMLDGDLNYHERRSDQFVTSDVGVVEDGRITVRGRADALVKILGELVDPVGVENELIAASSGTISPGQIAIVAVGDSRAGSRLAVAHVGDVGQELLERVLEKYHSECPGFKRVTSVVAVEEIPQSALGKVLRKELIRIVEGRQI